jgi:hypothetical protein
MEYILSFIFEGNVPLSLSLSASSMADVPKDQSRSEALWNAL